MAKRKNSIEAFEALSDAEKHRIWQDLDGLTPEQIKARSRPVNAAERRTWQAFKRAAGRPKIGKGVQVVSVGLEKDLLKRADALAKRKGVNRSALVSEALRVLIGSAA